jgi:stage V sporulation protein S
VRPTSNVQSMGGLVASSIAEDKKITLRAIGAGAVNQAVKVSIYASQQLALKGEILYTRNGFTTVEGTDGEDVTAIVMHCVLI